MVKNKWLKRIAGILLMLVPVVLFILPADYFDTGEAMCPSKRFLNLECLGCGLTRGVQHAIHFEFEKAWLFNKLTFVVLPIGFYLWLSYVLLWVWGVNLKEKLKSFFKR